MSSLSENTRVRLGLALLVGAPLAGVIYAAAVLSTRSEAHTADILSLKAGYSEFQRDQTTALQAIQKDIADIKEKQSANAADITATVRALGERVDRIGSYLREGRR